MAVLGGEEGSGFPRISFLHVKDPALPAQPHQLVALSRRQAIPAVLVMSAWASQLRRQLSLIAISAGMRAMGLARSRASSTARRRNSRRLGWGHADSFPRGLRVASA